MKAWDFPVFNFLEESLFISNGSSCRVEISNSRGENHDFEGKIELVVIVESKGDLRVLLDERLSFNDFDAHLCSS